MSLTETLYSLLITSIILPNLISLQLNQLKFYSSSQKLLNEKLESESYTTSNVTLETCKILANYNGTQIFTCQIKNQLGIIHQHYVIGEER